MFQLRLQVFASQLLTSLFICAFYRLDAVVDRMAMDASAGQDDSAGPVFTLCKSWTPLKRMPKTT